MRLAVPLLAAVLLSLCCAGCRAPVRPREVAQLQPIQTLGCDRDNGDVIVSASSGRDLGGGEAALLTARGRSVTEAIRDLQHWSSREALFFAHIRFVVMGEEAARRGAGPMLDFFERNTQTPLDLPLFVVRGGTAVSAVTAADPDYEVTAQLAALMRDAERMGTEHCFTLLEIARQLGRSGTALCPAVRIAAAETHVPTAVPGTPALLPAGYAVLRDGVLVGFLDEEEAMGADLLLGLAGQGCYVLPFGRGRVTLELRRARAVITPGPEGAAQIRLECRAGIVEASGAEELTGEALGELSAALADRLCGQVAAAMNAAARLGTDFLELRRRLGRSGQDDAPPAGLPWTAEVTAVIERSYDISESADVTGAEARRE